MKKHAANLSRQLMVEIEERQSRLMKFFYSRDGNYKTSSFYSIYEGSKEYFQSSRRNLEKRKDNYSRDQTTNVRNFLSKLREQSRL